MVLTDGVRVVGGHIQRIDGVAENLHGDFRATFGMEERQQIMRVGSDEPMPFPDMSRVSILSLWELPRLIAQMKRALARLASWLRKAKLLSVDQICDIAVSKWPLRSAGEDPNSIS